MAFTASQQPGQINVTPLIDVLLVLIIIFLVITPLAPRGLPAAVPQKPDSASVSASQPSSLVLAIARDLSLQLNQQPLDRKELPLRLEALVAAHAQPVLFIAGDRELEFRAVAEIIDVARAAGMDRIALMP